MKWKEIIMTINLEPYATNNNIPKEVIHTFQQVFLYGMLVVAVGSFFIGMLFMEML